MSLYAQLLRTFTLPITLSRENAVSALKHWRVLEKSQYWSRRQLLDYQWQQLQPILKQAYDHVPYYRRVMDEHGLSPDSFKSLDDLQKMPILDRATIEKNMRDLIATNFKESELQKSETGGTSTRRIIFYRNQESSNIKRAIAWRFEGWMGRKPCDKMCYFWPPHMDFHEHESWKLRFRRRYLERERMYYTGAATDEQLLEFYEDLISFKPEFLKIFPSGLDRFAQVMKEKKLRPPKVKGILSTGEILYASQRKTFEEVFQCQVYDMYGSREVGNTSSQCGHHEGRHIAMETQIVELIKDGKQVDFGEEGELVITDLTNFGFPLIRYAINDFAMASPDQCACGRELPLMSAGIGRVADNFFGKDGRRHSGLALEINVLRTGVDVGQCQFIQQKWKKFLVRLVPDPEPTEQMRTHIRTAIQKVVGEDVEVEIQLVDEIPRERSGKIRLLKCEVDESEISHADTGA